MKETFLTVNNNNFKPSTYHAPKNEILFRVNGETGHNYLGPANINWECPR